MRKTVGYHHWRHVLLLSVPAVLLSGCGTDGTQSVTPPPPEGPLAIVLDFCPMSVPTFFAYRNDGEAWTRVSPDASGSFAFTAAPKVAIAFVLAGGYRLRDKSPAGNQERRSIWMSNASERFDESFSNNSR